MLMSLFFLSCFSSTVWGIDRNEWLGTCFPGFNVTSNKYIHENEGVWFPQYRNRQPNNDEFKCHTLYEKMIYGDASYNLQVKSFYTRAQEIESEESTLQYYTQKQRGLLVDSEFMTGVGEYAIYNYIIDITPEYRVRYVCTDHVNSGEPVVYVETRQLYPTGRSFRRAVAALRTTGIHVILDRIVQRNCTRPLDPNGHTLDSSS